MNDKLKPRFPPEPIRQAPMTPGARAIMEARQRRASTDRMPPRQPPVGNMLPGKPGPVRMPPVPGPIRQAPIDPNARSQRKPGVV